MLLLRRDARGSARALRRVCGGLEGHQQSCAFAAEAAAPLRSRRFVDWLRVLARAGDGGSGCASFWHAPSRRKRGPDGGNGGHGGDVVLCADAGVRCLAGVSTSLGGEKGGRGGPQGRAGRRGEDCLVRVPVGTVVWQRLDVSAEGDEQEDTFGELGRQKRLAAQSGGAEGEALAEEAGGGTGRNFRPALRLLTDLSRDGASLVVARGGRGGRGNASLGHDELGSQRDDCEPGAAGGFVPLLLELKVVADVGLVGPPNVGKSTLLAKLSNARPDVADYAFTTLRPQLGRVNETLAPGAMQFVAGVHASATLADIPGLIEGAHANRGLGHSFLRHVERCAALLLVIDLAAGAQGRPGARAAAQLRTLLAELAAYDASLPSRPLLVVGTKLDLPGAARALAGLRRSAAAAALPPPLGLSSVTGAGVEDVRAALLRLAQSVQQA